MAKLLTGRDVWVEIKRAARKASSRHVAVAYLGAASPKLLALKSGDVLVVNLSEAAVRAGATNVQAARSFFRRGVNLCNSEHLHAKVFAFDNVVIVGSANASSNSADILEEAAVRIVDARVAAGARRFVLSQANQTVTPAYLRLCARWQRESAPDRKRLAKPPKAMGGSKPRGSRIWILDSKPTDFDTRATDDRSAQRQIRSPRQYVREPISWSRAPNFGPQDQVIIAHFEGGHLEVSPPGRFLARGASTDGQPVVYIELPRRPRVASVAKFRRLVRQAFKSRTNAIPTRRVPQAWVSEFLQLWPQGYSRARR